MGPVTCIAVYLTIWWTVLFAILPLGVQSHAEAGIDVKDGGDPGAPVDPKIFRKFITTSWVSAIVFVVLYVVIFIAGKFGWFLPDIARTY
jgi:predicted secreted protein